MTINNQFCLIYFATAKAVDQQPLKTSLIFLGGKLETNPDNLPGWGLTLCKSSNFSYCGFLISLTQKGIFGGDCRSVCHSGSGWRGTDGSGDR